MKICLRKKKQQIKTRQKDKKKKRKERIQRRESNPGPLTCRVDALSIAQRQLTLRVLPMKFCWLTPFEAGRVLFMKNWKIYSRKTNMFWQLKLYFNSFRRLWRAYGRQVSRKTVKKCLAACDSWRLQRRITYVSATVNISVFIEQRNISFQNDISLKTMRLGVLSWEKLKHRETHGRIASLDQLRLGVEEQLLIFSSCLSPGRVKKLQKFIKFCLKVGHSANLKHSKSTWRQSSCDSSKCTKSAHRDRGTGTIYDRCRFDIGRFRVEPTDLRKVSTSQWQICILQCPTCS